MNRSLLPDPPPDRRLTAGELIEDFSTFVRSLERGDISAARLAKSRLTRVGVSIVLTGRAGELGNQRR